MKNQHKNIEQLFNSEKNSNTELSKAKIEDIIQQLPSLQNPNSSTTIHSILNFKNIIMISVPFILVISALMLMPNSQENIKTNNNNNIESVTQAQTSTNGETMEKPNMENKATKHINSEAMARHKTDKITIPSQVQLPSTTVDQLIPPIASSSIEKSQNQTSNAPTEPIASDPLPSSGSQIARPQSITNNGPLSSLEALRLKKLLYKNLIKDGIIKSKNIKVEIELLSNSIIVNGEKLNQELLNKYSELTQEVGSGKDKKIKMNPEYIKIGDFTEDGFKGMGVGRFQEEDITKNNKPNVGAKGIDLNKESQAKIKRRKLNEAITAEAKDLTKFIDKLYENQDRTYKKSFFTGNQIAYREIQKLHKEFYQLLLSEGRIDSDKDFVVFELGEDQLLVNLKAIEASNIQPYLEIISSFQLKRKDNRMIKMSKNTIAYGDYRPGSFTGSFYEMR